MIVSELISFGSSVLKKKKITSHLLDSELLLSNVLNEKRETLLSTDAKISLKNIRTFNKLIKRREKNEPIAYILKKKEFWSKEFLVNKNTLIPRPETELLVEKIVNYFTDKSLFILDVGTGSGCILLALLDELKKAQGIGIDISNRAIKVAIKNSKKLNLKNKPKFYNRSLDQIFGVKFDLIVSNPPYISSYEIKNLSEDIRKYEPRLALDGGNDGLDVIKKVIYKSRSILKRKGMLALEIGFGQYKKVSQILKLKGFKIKFLIRDYQNNVRCILSTLV
jgi:release factor glutamine methyltransferase|tara:strand:- start:1942 stop:2778 length:837 start_codon:yes stop_codon:yes gene_type:complete